jgi:tryptophan 2,3-dioxygenase
LEHKEKKVYYSDYLQLDKILNAQTCLSEKAHDEMLFIIVHQAYELWFKQIKHELESVIQTFDKNFVIEKEVGIAVSRLNRIAEILKLLIAQFQVLETMTPLDFLDFRNNLFPASGFQSYQFRIVEVMLGLKKDQRLPYSNTDYKQALENPHIKEIESFETKKSLFDVIQNWLERMPFIKLGGYDFWNNYEKVVKDSLTKEENIIKSNQNLTEDKKNKQLKEFESTKRSFESILNENVYNDMVKEGFWRMSHKSLLSALFISLYRDEPILHMPYVLLNTVIDIDELFTTWRYRHAIMVHRMIGSKIGTGGSSGHNYLTKTVEQHRIFVDLFNLSTFLIPRKDIPDLPWGVHEILGFYYKDKDEK